ncbi:hypothetical protein DICPUDRAFT_80146 [Dictyostelium purpureum]|uniref:Zinc finger protein n=1 Tax=Dictyostelium purpureum TaxID=5786 RepID=F0ZPN7_DICPU|nr:uncharacterized protein DICPUDRAFT_80146 [Dictyostelium purpureum]EGC34094.1 hypothetical protein DICPUDRAFT_80146 [Dictyostelium purpureum]|eukprot:XP_003289387.1 hypothetical protein DICPUDRAFT_80146 [Dictyostelium purpureum]
MTEINNNNNIDIENKDIDNNIDNNEEKKPNCLFKKPTKQRNNIRKRSDDQMLNNNNNNNTDKEEEKTEEEDSDKNNKKKVKINQYTTKQEKKNEFSFGSTGVAGSSINSAELSTTEYHNEEDEYENTVLSSRGLKREDIEKQKQATNDDGIYRGMGSYSTFTEKKSDLSYKGGGVKAGPLKTIANVRLSSRIDYQPDVCKDYKQTGQCTFGDACKFLHDRTDYKSGWQIDREWEEEQKTKKSGKDTSSSSTTATSTADELPFACFICKNQYDNPVMTKCKHFFCEKCALDQNKKNKKCALCGEPTQGVFSQPKKTIDKLMEVSKAHFNNLNK